MVGTYESKMLVIVNVLYLILIDIKKFKIIAIIIK